MKDNHKEPVYTIGVVARLLEVCSETLRIWERKGLIKPARLGKNRFYSEYDLDRLEHIKELIQKEHVNIAGVKNMLSATKCWETKNCKPEKRGSCPVYTMNGNA